MAFLGGGGTGITLAIGSTMVARIVDYSGATAESEVITMSNQVYGGLTSIMDVFPGEYLNGSVNFQIEYAKAQHSTLMAQLNKKQAFTITYPDDGKHVLNGMISSIGVAAPMKDRMTSTITISYDGSTAFSG